MICEQCKKEIPEGSEFCPYCGCTIPKKQENKVKNVPTNKKTKVIIILLVILVLVLGSALGAGVYYHINIRNELETQIDSLEKSYDTLKGEFEKQKDANIEQHSVLSNDESTNHTVTIEEYLEFIEKDNQRIQELLEKKSSESKEK